jgi:hypothetical protein
VAARHSSDAGDQALPCQGIQPGHSELAGHHHHLLPIGPFQKKQ